LSGLPTLMSEPVRIRTETPVDDWLPAGWVLRCHGCGAQPEDTLPDYCAGCGFPVAVLQQPAAGESSSPAGDGNRGLTGHTRCLPLRMPPSRLSLGEGDTPLVTVPAAGRHAGLRDLHVKLESVNPSGSFKDRAVLVGVARAVETGAHTVVCASSGNAAGSVAMYAARAGLRAVITVPGGVPAAKVGLCHAHGAVVLSLRGDYSASFRLARELSRANRWPNLSTTFVNPFCVAGLSSVAYELHEQSPVPIGTVIVPVGAGPLLHGVHAGYGDLLEAGHADRVPRLVAAQSASCAPIVAAFESGRSTVEAWPGPVGDVSGLNDPLNGYPADGTVTLRSVRATEGVAVAVTDEEIWSASDVLRTQDGVFVEPAAAVSVAAAVKLAEAGILAAEERVVCLATGHGLKSGTGAAEERIVAVDGLAEAQRRLDQLQTR
jgi:threonine synthase